jgi:hypothetical protein
MCAVWRSRRQGILERFCQYGLEEGIHFTNSLSRARLLTHTLTVPTKLLVCGRCLGEDLASPMFPEMTRDQVSRIEKFIGQIAPLEIALK